MNNLLKNPLVKLVAGIFLQGLVNHVTSPSTERSDAHILRQGEPRRKREHQKKEYEDTFGYVPEPEPVDSIYEPSKNHGYSFSKLSQYQLSELSKLPMRTLKFLTKIRILNKAELAFLEEVKFGCKKFRHDKKN